MNARTPTCERCRAVFGCDAGGAAGCWCAEVTLTDALRADLRRAFGDCLCGACLRELSSAAAGREKAGADRLRPA